MLSTLLSDPMLTLLEPMDLVKVRQLCKEARDVVDHHRATQSHYTVRKYTYKGRNDGMPYKIRERLYQLYPAVKHLTVELGGWEQVGSFLRPTLQSLHITLPVQVTKRKEYDEWYLRNIWCFLDPLNRVREFLQTTPDSELSSLRISFQPEVEFIFEEGDEMIVDYDRDGPIYESLDVWVTTKKAVKPSEAFWLLRDTMSSLREVEEALQMLFAAKKWRSFTLPEAFPGASLCPGATLVDPTPYDMEECESVEAYVYELYREKLNSHEPDF